jgi:UDP-glucose 4-epimerase
MMSLKDAVTLVIQAFTHAAQGDMWVQKAPAATIRDLAETLMEIFDKTSPIHCIGTRHGEKVFETLLSKEESVKAIEHDGYFQVPADTRDLNYDVFVSEGDSKITTAQEYNSHNTHRLNRQELKDLLLNLDFVQNQLKSAPNSTFRN